MLAYGPWSDSEAQEVALAIAPPEDEDMAGPEKKIV
jgi:hypothetical protein